MNKETKKLINDILDDDDIDVSINFGFDDGEEEEEVKENKNFTKTIHITSPYISVIISSECEEDSIEDLKKHAEDVMDKYRNHHLVGKDKREDYL